MMEDLRLCVAPGKGLPRLAFAARLPYNLYHYVRAVAARPGPVDPAPPAAIARLRGTVAALGLPGPFDLQDAWERPIAEAGSCAGLDLALRQVLGRRGGRLAALLRQAGPAYAAEVWPSHQAALRRGLGDLRALLAPHAAGLLRELGRLFRVRWPAAAAVHLVAQSYTPARSYSHPATVEVGSCRGLRLVEVTLHELVHAAEVASWRRRTLGALLQDAAQGPLGWLPDWEDRLFVLWHGLLFWGVESLLRERLDPGYRGYGTDHGLYDAWVGGPEFYADLWHAYGRRELEAPALARALVERAAERDVPRLEGGGL